MSLSRPVKFPLLKLPFLCIKCVLHNSDLFDIIFFASISNRTRRIVRNSKYPLKEIDVIPNRSRSIGMGNTEAWYFTHNQYGYGVPVVLQRNSEPFLTGERIVHNTVQYLHSHTAGEELDALKMCVDFMIDVFGCSIRKVFVDDKLSDLFGLGISSVKVLHISDIKPVNTPVLKFFLETVKVTDEYIFFAPIPEDFTCDPQIFKCRQLSFSHPHSGDWVTLEILYQFDIPRLIFRSHRLTREDIVSYVTNWFNSENRKLESLFVYFRDPITLQDLKIDHLDPMPFCEERRNKWTLDERWKREDMSSGMDILRQDGMLATFRAHHTSIFFYVWHKRFPDDD